MFVRTTERRLAHRIILILLAAGVLGVSLPAPQGMAGPFSVIEELLVPGGPALKGYRQEIQSSSQLSSHSFRFSARTEAEGGRAPIQNVVPLEDFGLPGVGLVLDHSSPTPAFDGVTYQMNDTMRLDATWDFGDEERSLEGFIDLHLSF